MLEVGEEREGRVDDDDVGLKIPRGDIDDDIDR